MAGSCDFAQDDKVGDKRPGPFCHQHIPTTIWIAASRYALLAKTKGVVTMCQGDVCQGDV